MLLYYAHPGGHATMPRVESAAAPARTKTVETRTIEEIPIKEEGGGLGMPVLEFLRTCSDEQLSLSQIYIYRYEPVREGLLIKLGGYYGDQANPNPPERVDEGWIQNRFGGGVY